MLLSYRPHGSPCGLALAPCIAAGCRAVSGPGPSRPLHDHLSYNFSVKCFLYQLLSDSGYRPGHLQCSLSGCRHTTEDSGNYSLCLLNRSFFRIRRTRKKAADEGCPSFSRLCPVALSSEFKVFHSPPRHKVHEV